MGLQSLLTHRPHCWELPRNYILEMLAHGERPFPWSCEEHSQVVFDVLEPGLNVGYQRYYFRFPTREKVMALQHYFSRLPCIDKIYLKVIAQDSYYDIYNVPVRDRSYMCLVDLPLSFCCDGCITIAYISR